MIKSGNVLVINCGSSSIRFSVIDHETSSHLIRGSVERIGEENAQLKYMAPHGMSSQPLGAAIDGCMQSRGGLFQTLCSNEPRVSVSLCRHLPPKSVS